MSSAAPHLAASLLVALAACSEVTPEEASSSARAHDRTAGVAAGAWFADVTEAWGLDFVHDAGASPEKHLPETMGGGAALFDADSDGDLDLYLVQSGAVPTAAVRRAAAPRPHNRLYANSGDGRFEDASAASGAAAHGACGMGVAAGDATGDGRTDLYVTNFGPDAFFANAGELAFADATASSGFSNDEWTAGATFCDGDGDGDLDLYVTAYVAIDVEHPTWCGRKEPGWRSYCHPDHYAGLRDRYWKNDGAGRFADVSGASGVGERIGKGLGAIAADLDDDGDLDVYVAHDSVLNQMWTNAGDGTFVDDTLLSGTGVDARGATEAGMGLACADVDGDLDLDLFVTNFDHESNTLYLNEGGGMFRDATVASGLEAPSRMPVGFGCLLEDFDQDGHLDLAVANGHIIDNIHLYDEAQTWRQRAQLFAGDGTGRFRELGQEAGAFTAEPFVGRSLLAGDLDGDGDLDLVLTQCGGAAKLFRNDAARGRALELRGLAPGARVTLELASGRKLLRTAGPAPSYFGASHPTVHVGLGEEKVAALRIREPGRPPYDVSFAEPLAGGVWSAAQERR